jgi:uncharacterized protein (TIGR02147 family)
MVSGWYHLAVLELMGTKDFSSQHDWIAHRLGITPFEAEEALGRLERLKFIEKTTDGYKKSPSFFSTTRNIPSQAIREYQKKILLKAMDAIELQSVQEREISSTTMPIPVSRIPEAQNLITEFRRRLESLLSDPNNKNDEVYCLSIQFFRLTHLSTQSAKENLEA